jgi:hypothetical protein
MKAKMFYLLMFMLMTTLLKAQSDVTSPKPDSVSVIDKQEMTEVRNDIINAVRNNYVFPEKAETVIAEFIKWFDAHPWQSPTPTKNFTNEVYNWFVTFTKDKHFYFKEVGNKAKGAINLGSSWFFDKYNYGVAKVEWIPEGIGYIDYRGFNFMPVPDSRKTINMALKMLEKADTLILDLRQNPGGDGDMACYLYSCLVPEDSVTLLLNTNHMDGVVTTTTFSSYKTLPAQRYPNKKLYILTSKKTASSAEVFTYICRLNGRATIIGEKTSGAGHNMRTCPAGKRFTFALPMGRIYDPKTGLGFQETEGIRPDIEVESGKALDKALEMIKGKA